MPYYKIDECIDALGESTVISAPDTNSGYWQVQIDDNDKVKTASTFHFEIYRLKQMMFGLQNAPGLSQQAIDVKIAPVK